MRNYPCVSPLMGKEADALPGNGCLLSAPELGRDSQWVRFMVLTGVWLASDSLKTCHDPFSPSFPHHTHTHIIHLSLGEMRVEYKWIYNDIFLFFF